MSPMDIATVSEASNKLSDFAKTNIYEKYVDCQVFTNGFGLFSNQNQVGLESFELFLKHVGEVIKKIVLNAECLQNASVNQIVLVLKYCPNLEELRLLNYSLPLHEVSVLKEKKCLVSHVALIDSDYLELEWAELFKQWTSVRAVTIQEDGKMIEQEILFGLKTLEKLSLAGFDLFIPEFKQFLRHHSGTLRSLSLVDMYLSAKKSMGLIELTPNLEHLELSFHRYDNITLRFHSLKNLKHLQLQTHIQYEPPSNPGLEWSLEGLDKLEQLDLFYFQHVVFHTEADLPSLKVLRIVFSSTEGDIIAENIANLRNLEQLHLQDCEDLTGDDLVDIVCSNQKLKQIDYGVGDLTFQTISKLIEVLSRPNLDKKSGYWRPRMLLNVARQPSKEVVKKCRSMRSHKGLTAL